MCCIWGDTDIDPSKIVASFDPDRNHQSFATQMKFISILFLLAACFAACVQAEEASAAGEQSLTMDEIKKMPVKKLKQFLAARGLECKGCAEKEDFVKLAFDNRDTPLAAKPEESAAASSSGDERSPETKKKELDDLMASLRGSGLGDNIKMFTKDDFAGMSAEQMASKFGEAGTGGGSGRGKGGKGKSRGSSNAKKSSTKGAEKKPTSKPAKRIQEEEGEQIEL